MQGYTLEWVDQGETRMLPLKPGLTTIGGPGANVAILPSGGVQLQVWDHPPKLIYMGATGEDLPQVGGSAVEEAPLQLGDVIRFRGHSIVFSGSAPESANQTVTQTNSDQSGEAQLEELPIPKPTVSSGPSGMDPQEQQIWSRLKAGLLVEAGQADKQVAKAWQNAVIRGEFDPDASARDILKSSSSTSPASPELVQRSSRLMRDLLMAPVQRGARGASRRMRGAAKGGVAYLLAQLIAISVYSLLLMIFFLLARMQWGWSLDLAMDRILGLFGGGAGS